MLNWATKQEDLNNISLITDRYLKLLVPLHIKLPKRLDVIMDVEATHSNGCPLKLDELLKADNFDFVHDITGIRNNIDRKTGKLENYFLPRYAKL